MNQIKNIISKNLRLFVFVLAVVILGSVIGDTIVRAQPDTSGLPRGAELIPPCDPLTDPACKVWQGLTVNEDMIREFDGLSGYTLPENRSMFFVGQVGLGGSSLLGSTGLGLRWLLSDDLAAGDGTSFVGSEKTLTALAVPLGLALTVDAREGNQFRAEISDDVAVSLTNFSQDGQTLRLILCNTTIDLPINWDAPGRLLLWPGGTVPIILPADACSLYSFFASTGTSAQLFGAFVENFQ